jgi:hypothetical protein
MKLFEIKVTKVQTGDRPMRMFGNNAAALEWVTADEPGNPSAVGSRSTAKLPWWFDRTEAAAGIGAR